ncbi:MAG: ATP-binding cassette domain-containing protein [Patescibacteria group bacterium]|jgi:ABC-2 type transport system ATP-binding protein
MIKISHLTKKYDVQKALDDISLEVKKGEIVGFLGPNGAGKTTTMKILTGFISPTSGEVQIDGINVQEDSLSVRKKIGYLPENNPLYEDMTVREYLSFVSGMREVTDEKQQEEIINTCGLSNVLEKNISELSKGYRQRTGLASALMHNPEILILDEPTSGLDPNQIVEIRNLIKKIGEQKTVILSTHILPEVQATCDRVVIINEGKIAAVGTIEEIIQRAKGKEEIYAKVKGDEEKVKKVLSDIPAVATVTKAEEESAEIKGYKITAEEEKDLREEIFDALVANGFKLLELKRIRVSLEDVFRELTTKEI